MNRPSSYSSDPQVYDLRDAASDAMQSDSDRIEDAFYHAAKDGGRWNEHTAALNLASYCAELWMALTPAQRAILGPREIGQDVQAAMESRWDDYNREHE